MECVYFIDSNILVLYRMSKLLKLDHSQKCTDLTVSFAAPQYDQDDLPGPPIQYIIDNL